MLPGFANLTKEAIVTTKEKIHPAQRREAALAEARKRLVDGTLTEYGYELTVAKADRSYLRNMKKIHAIAY